MGDVSSRSWAHFQTGTHDDEQITLVLVNGYGPMKIGRQGLAEEDDIWLEYRSVQRLRTFRTMWNSLLKNLLLDLVALDAMGTVLTRGRRERSVTLDETLDGTEMLERVDVLRVVTK